MHIYVASYDFLLTPRAALGIQDLCLTEQRNGGAIPQEMTAGITHN